MKKLNEIETLRDFSKMLNIPVKKMTYVLYIKETENLYRTFEIPKKSGGFRQIKAPHEDLKDVQKKLALWLGEYQNTIWKQYGIKNNISHGFQKDKNIITNAAIHRNKRYVLNVDLEDFFGSFHFGRVKGFFQKNKHFNLPEKLALIIAQLSCANGVLPQGAPSSPIIANLICNILDMKIIKLAKKYKMNYTRYADDLTFSTNTKRFVKQQSDFINELSFLVEKSGLKINRKKTRLLYADSRQDVTGLVVNEKVNVDRSYYKTTRAMAHSLYTTGEFRIGSEKGSVNQLEGRFSFVNQLDWHNNIMKKKRGEDAKIGFRNLNSREKEYQKFLFYKYFFANKKPLIITEGKTDILYIKSALKSLYQYYPELINKKNDGSFEFKVSFLKRTKRLRYFLDIEKDGAPMMKKIYNYFSNKNNDYYPNYSKIMLKTGIKPLNPVIMVFDNEMANSKKQKPLRNFINYTEINKNDDLVASFSENLHLNIKSNLHILTHQLVDGQTECEIEDLFNKDTLNQLIGCEKFNRNKKHAKVEFAEYISNNYLKIDFTNFQFMLNNMNTIVKKYRENQSLPDVKTNTNKTLEVMK